MGLTSLNQTYVAFLDILGFKELVINNSQQKLEQIFNFDTIVAELAESDQMMKKVLKVKGKTDFLSVSDSIILWTDSDAPHNFESICTFVQRLLYHGLNKGIPLRGGISIGPLSVVTNTHGESQQTNMFGKAIVSAYAIENYQDWSGCVIDSKVIENYNRQKAQLEKNGIHGLRSIQDYVDKNLITNYEVPKKHGPVTNEYVINWVNPYKTVVDATFIIEGFKAHNKTIDNWAVKTKINNTIKFLNEIKN